MGIYDGNNPKDVAVTDPVEGASTVAVLNDCDRQTRRALIYGSSAANAKTANYTLTDTDHFVSFNGVSLTATLPQISAVSSASVAREYIIKNNHATSNLAVACYAGDTAPVTIVPPGATLIVLGVGGTTWTRISQNIRVRVNSNGSYVLLVGVASQTKSIGPTGSGANVILSQLDGIPAGVSFVRIIFAANSGTTAGDLTSCFIYDMSDVCTGRIEVRSQAAGAGNNYNHMEMLVPVDSNRMFKVSIGVGGPGYLQGMVTGYIW